MILDFTKVGQASPKVAQFSMDLDSYPGEYPINPNYNRPIPTGTAWGPAILGAAGGGYIGHALAKALKLKGLLGAAGVVGGAALGSSELQKHFR